jgi:hypothetical protein
LRGRREDDAALRWWGGWTLIAIGLVLVAFSAVAYIVADHNASTLTFAVLGVGCLVAGPMLSRLRSAEVGPGTAKFTFDSPLTADLASTDEITEEQTDEPDEIVAAARFQLASAAQSQILKTSETGPLAGAELYLYLYDHEANQLVPVDPSGEDPSTDEVTWWPVGTGATGSAFERCEFVYVVGDQIRDTTYGVTPEQAERFNDLTVVASMPVTNAEGRAIAVITATTTAPDRGGMADEEGTFNALLAKSMLTARVLVDLLGWFPDVYDAGHD